MTSADAREEVSAEGIDVSRILAYSVAAIPDPPSIPDEWVTPTRPQSWDEPLLREPGGDWRPLWAP